MKPPIRWFPAMAAFCLSLSAVGQTLEPISRDPYVGAIVVNAATGEVLQEDNADAQAYPASVVKLMNLLVVLEQVKKGAVRMDDPVRTTAEAARMGGTQVYLAEQEVFTVEELLYALMIASANDASVALAIHVAGSRDAFVAMMNETAARLGMTNSRFHSPHGLPPGAGQLPDVSTARDIARLSQELIQYPEVFAFSSTQVRGFRNDTFEMRSHNPLLASFDGCDGLKTGYFRAAGYSIAATAERQGVRVIAVILGSRDRNTRNTKTAEWLSQGFLRVPRT